MLFNCKYQMIIQGVPYYCCKAQDGCPPVCCPNNIKECVIFNNKNNMIAYIARDSNGIVYLYKSKPEKGLVDWLAKDNFFPITELPEDINPRWEDNEPIKVKLNIEKI